MSGKKPAKGGSAARSAKAIAQARETQRRNRILFAVLSVVVVAVLVTVIAVAVAQKQSNSTQPGASPAASSTTAAPDINSAPALVAVGQTTPPPWPAPADASAAVRAAGLPMLSAEGSALHIHAHLDVRVDGQNVPVPADIGIDEQRGAISPLHTHDATGVIHIESPVQRQFSLGEFFSEWGVSMSADHLGALKVDAAHPLQVYVNGTPRPGDPAAILLNAHDEIALVYGPQTQIPTHYDFAPNL